MPSKISPSTDFAVSVLVFSGLVAILHSQTGRGEKATNHGTAYALHLEEKDEVEQRYSLRAIIRLCRGNLSSQLLQPNLRF
jgi:hypothetical protein